MDLFFEFINAGIKVCVKAPSAKIRLKRLGSLNATKKMSLYMLAPRTEAVKRSRIKPKMRETSIPILLVKKFLIIINNFTKTTVK
jgi:hypothetical protein